jgi:glutamate-1-semialdehyde 2,1-aminomutase
MAQKKSWRYITDLGKKIKQKWEKIAKNHKLKISISGIDAMPGFNFLCKNNLTYRTFITQEMLKKKILASNNIYCSLSHNERIVENYFDKLDKIFKKIKKFEDNEVNPKLFLEGPECISGLNRFN